MRRMFHNGNGAGADVDATGRHRNPLRPVHDGRGANGHLAFQPLGLMSFATITRFAALAGLLALAACADTPAPTPAARPGACPVFFEP